MHPTISTPHTHLTCILHFDPPTHLQYIPEFLSHPSTYNVSLLFDHTHPLPATALPTRSLAILPLATPCQHIMCPEQLIIISQEQLIISQK